MDRRQLRAAAIDAVAGARLWSAAGNDREGVRGAEARTPCLPVEPGHAWGRLLPRRRLRGAPRRVRRPRAGPAGRGTATRLLHARWSTCIEGTIRLRVGFARPIERRK